MLNSSLIKMQKIKLTGLEAVRCYAALLIIFFHLFHLANIEVPTSLGFIGTHFGFGVPLFFMVSAFGLFLGYQFTLTRIDQLKDYYLRRFFRIAPLFYFVMLFYLPYLWVIYDGHLVSVNKFLVSLLFIFNFIPSEVEGYVWASWSIGVEMVFYLTLPLAVLAINNFRSAFLFLLLSVYIKYQWVQSFNGAAETIVLTSFKTYFILAHIHYFAMGIFSYFVWKKIIQGKYSDKLGHVLVYLAVLGFVGLVIFSTTIITLFSYFFSLVFAQYFYQLAIALCLSMFIISLCLAPIKLLVNRWVCLLGKTSFSLYLWHPIVIVSLTKGGAYEYIYENVGSVGFSWWLSVLLTFVILVPLARLSYQMIEVPGMKLIRYF